MSIELRGRLSTALMIAPYQNDARVRAARLYAHDCERAGTQHDCLRALVSAPAHTRENTRKSINMNTNKNNTTYEEEHQQSVPRAHGMKHSQHILSNKVTTTSKKQQALLGTAQQFGAPLFIVNVQRAPIQNIPLRVCRISAKLSTLS